MLCKQGVAGSNPVTSTKLPYTLAFLEWIRLDEAIVSLGLFSLNPILHLR